MSFPFIEENTASRLRLQSLIKRLSDEDFSRSTPYGWTISALLTHLAFWDNRVLVLLRRWREKGVDESPIDSEAMNEALMPLCLAMDPHAAIELCLSSAEAVDAELEAITPELIEEIEASPNHFRFNRGLHRNDHLNDIERLIGLPRPASVA